MTESFDVDVKTAVGRYQGVVEIERHDGGLLTGFFEIMKMRSAFEGSYDESGTVSFSGSLDVPIGKIDYSVKGTIDGERFSGSADTTVGHFEFTPSKRYKK